MCKKNLDAEEKEDTEYSSGLSNTFFYPQTREHRDISMITGPREQVKGP